jgi:hypothetical protein
MSDNNTSALEKLFEIIQVNPSNINDKVKMFLNSTSPSKKDELEDTPLIQILSYVSKVCKTILVEKFYIDKDYADEFVNYYSRTFFPHKRHCIRFIFINHEINSIDEMLSINDYSNKVIGFSVLRPLDSYRVGRTVLDVSLSGNYIHSCSINEVHLFGSTIKVSGVPFIQQDARVGVCAQAATWMTANAIFKKHGGKSYLPFEITSLATSLVRLGNLVPSDGLTSEQISNALIEMGYTPLFMYRPEGKSKKNFQVLKYIYPYIESGIPVIVGIKREDKISGELVDHTVVIIGHSSDFSLPPKKGSRTESDCNEADGGKLSRLVGKLSGKAEDKNIEYFYSNRSFINNLIVHDDARGPYIEQPPDDDFLDNIDSIVIAQPRDTFLRGHIAEEVAAALIKDDDNIKYMTNIFSETDWKKTLDSYPEFKTFIDMKSNDEINLRTYLTLGTAFKESISYRSSKDENKINDAIVQEYTCMSLPKYIWVTEISTTELIKGTDGNKIIGEILIDYTSFQSEFGFLALHVPGLFVTREPLQENKMEHAFIGAEQPYLYGMASLC